MANVNALPAAEPLVVQPLSYAQPEAPRRNWPLATLANLIGTYPLMLAGLLYGQWLLSWYFLGHIPRSSLDDPKFIDGANWMHWYTWKGLTWAYAAFWVGLALNVLYLVMSRSRSRSAAIRMAVFTGLWITIYTLLTRDPGRVLYWWWD